MKCPVHSVSTEMRIYHCCTYPKCERKLLCSFCLFEHPIDHKYYIRDLEQIIKSQSLEERMIQLNELLNLEICPPKMEYPHELQTFFARFMIQDLHDTFCESYEELTSTMLEKLAKQTNFVTNNVQDLNEKRSALKEYYNANNIRDSQHMTQLKSFDSLVTTYLEGFSNYEKGYDRIIYDMFKTYTQSISTVTRNLEQKLKRLCSVCEENEGAIQRVVKLEKQANVFRHDIKKLKIKKEFHNKLEFEPVLELPTIRGILFRKGKMLQIFSLLKNKYLKVVKLPESPKELITIDKGKHVVSFYNKTGENTEIRMEILRVPSLKKARVMTLPGSLKSVTEGLLSKELWIATQPYGLVLFDLNKDTESVLKFPFKSSSIKQPVDVKVVRRLKKLFVLTEECKLFIIGLSNKEPEIERSIQMNEVSICESKSLLNICYLPTNQGIFVNISGTTGSTKERVTFLHWIGTETMILTVPYLKYQKSGYFYFDTVECGSDPFCMQYSEKASDTQAYPVVQFKKDLDVVHHSVKVPKLRKILRLSNPAALLLQYENFRFSLMY